MLSQTAHITGRVTNPDGQISTGTHITAYRKVQEPWQGAASTSTNSTGSYDLSFLGPGTYRLLFEDLRHKDTWWPQATDVESASDIVVGPQDQIDHVDAQLLEGQTTGTMTLQQAPRLLGVPHVGWVLRLSGARLFPHAYYTKLDWLADGVEIPREAEGEYAIEDLYVGQHISARITYSRPGFAPITVTTPALGPVTPGFSVGTITPRMPQIYGTATVGGYLAYLTGGDWSPVPRKERRQWLADGDPIPGATGYSFSPSPAQVGKRISVTITGTRLFWTSATVTSAATTPVTAASVPSMVFVKPPALTGKARVGRRLHVVAGAFAPPQISAISFVWYADGRVIRGATGESLRLRRKQHGHRISVAVTVSSPGYTSATARTKPTRQVAPARHPT